MGNTNYAGEGAGPMRGSSHAPPIIPECACGLCCDLAHSCAHPRRHYKDLHHLTFVTADIDRLVNFYERIFDARVTVDLEENGLRHTFTEVGPHTVLHPFEILGGEPPPAQPMFERGRLDHFALNAASEEAFRDL